MTLEVLPPQKPDAYDGHCDGGEFVSQNQTGALIVIEREIRVAHLRGKRRHLEAPPFVDLLAHYFPPSAPAADGAVIVTANRIVAAACFLPLS